MEDLINTESIRSQINKPNYKLDEFLIANRFESLDSSIKELSEVEKTLNDELIKLINDNFDKFIELGNLNGSQELIDSVNDQLSKFNRLLNSTIDEFDDIKSKIANFENFLKSLNELKYKIKVVKLANSLIENLSKMLDVLENQLYINSNKKKELNKNDEVLVTEIGNMIMLINKLIINHDSINYKKFNSSIFKFNEILHDVKNFEVFKVKKLLKEMNQ
ncbi:hypothetical protein CLIB1444_04S02300 [[Candida] jaroonii]|uniref:Uncharacterized protein n=1 Tax=[Candida] jaroonii TaxID=467808 RepID=A0ACA9Y6N2_9ASCO|nr:hypothetical protein CLIB1444_04S02300 [[Candida] jaroonii]